MDTTQLQNLVRSNPTLDANGVLALAQADYRTLWPIPLSVLNPYLSSTGLVARLNRSADAIASSNQAGADQLKSFVAFCASAANPTFDTTNPAYAASAQALFTAMITLNQSSSTLGLTASEKTDIIAMGGGYAVADATLSDITVAMAAVTRATAVSNLRNLTASNYAAAQNLNITRIGKCDAIARSTTGTVPTDLAGLDAWTIG